MKVKTTYIFATLASLLFLSERALQKCQWEIEGYELERVSAPVRVISIDNPLLMQSDVHVCDDYVGQDSISAFFSVFHYKISPQVSLSNDTLYVHQIDMTRMKRVKEDVFGENFSLWLNGKQNEIILNGEVIWRKEENR